jgi:hypothetical protein
MQSILTGPHIKTLLRGPGPRYIEVDPLYFVAVRRDIRTGDVRAVRRRGVG